MSLLQNLKMEKKIYPIELEISGRNAMFLNPHTYPNGKSYPVPPPSACSGMIKSVLLQKSVDLVITKVEICSPIKYVGFAYNNSMEKAQRFDEILLDVRYVIHAIPVFVGGGQIKACNTHIYAERFNRHLRQGKNHRRICLGRSEFLPNYLGPRRADSKPIGESFSIDFFPMKEYNKGLSQIEYKTIEVKEGVVVYHA